MKRLAYLFGENKYQYLSELKYCHNDVNSLVVALEQLKFDVFPYFDLNFREFSSKIGELETKIKEDAYDEILIYFAGHGFQNKSVNYLACIDTEGTDSSSACHTSVKLDDILEVLDSFNDCFKIIILDACRNDPFLGGRGTESLGFAPISAPIGTIIEFSTSPGCKAIERDGHGLFTLSLLQHIKTKRIPVEALFKQVRNTLYNQSDKKQLSWEHSSLLGDFIFNDIFVINSSFSYSGVEKSHLNDYKSNLNNITDIVSDLMSNNYDNQNDAYKRLIDIDLSSVEKGDLFVIGRSLYYACNKAFAVTHFFEDIDRRIYDFNENVKMHILNGILYAIFFGENGQLRQKLYFPYYNKIISLIEKDEFDECKEFIQNEIYEVRKSRMIDNPGDSSMYIFDLKFTKNDRNCYDFCSLIYKGKEYYVDDSNYNIIKYDEEKFKELLFDNTLINQQNMDINVIGVTDKSLGVNFPDIFTLLDKTHYPWME